MSQWLAAPRVQRKREYFLHSFQIVLLVLVLLGLARIHDIIISLLGVLFCFYYY